MVAIKDEGDVDASMEKIVDELKQAVGSTTLSAVKAVSEKYRLMFEDLNQAAKHSQETQDKLVTFANRFRPMNTDALRYVMLLNAFARAMQNDKIPTMEDALGVDNPDFEAVSEVIEEISEDFAKITAVFVEVKDGYQALCDEANQLSLEAQRQVNVSSGQVTTAEGAQALGAVALGTSGMGGSALGIAIGAQGMAAWSTSLAAACMGPAGWCALIGFGAVAGGAALVGGQLAKDTHKQVREDMTKVYQVMNEIIQLLSKHSDQLEAIRTTLQEVTSNSQIIGKTVQTWKDKQANGKNISVPCRRAKRQLATVSNDCQTLQTQCDAYIKTEQDGQCGFWNIVK